MKGLLLALSLVGYVGVGVLAQPLPAALRAEIDALFGPVEMPLETPLREDGASISPALWNALDSDFESNDDAFDALLAAGRYDLNPQFRLIFLAVRGYRGLGVGLYDYDYLYVLDRRSHEITAAFALGTLEEQPVWLEQYDGAAEVRSTHGRVTADGTITQSTVRATLGLVIDDEESRSWETVSRDDLGTQRWAVSRDGHVARR